jgi:hypothetical protein
MKLSHRLGWPKVPGKFTLVDEDHQSCAGAFTARKRGAARSCAIGARGNSQPNQAVGTKTAFSSNATVAGRGPGRAAGYSQPADTQPPRRDHPDAIFRRLKRRCRW